MSDDEDGDGAPVPLLLLGIAGACVLIYYCIKALVLIESCG
jgi:hypothetical protein